MGVPVFDPWSLVIGFGAGILAVLVILAVRTRRVKDHLGGSRAGIKVVAQGAMGQGGSGGLDDHRADRGDGQPRAG